MIRSGKFCATHRWPLLSKERVYMQKTLNDSALLRFIVYTMQKLCAKTKIYSTTHLRSRFAILIHNSSIAR
uniref:Saposin B-type domain-containing protein n=1 Tax=Parascaris univalens TaxID=6257 RepID=A0A915BU32_PARUN